MARIAGVDLPRNKHVDIALIIYLWDRQRAIQNDSGCGESRCHKEGPGPE